MKRKVEILYVIFMVATISIVMFFTTQKLHYDLLADLVVFVGPTIVFIIFGICILFRKSTLVSYIIYWLVIWVFLMAIVAILKPPPGGSVFAWGYVILGIFTLIVGSIFRKKWIGDVEELFREIESRRRNW